MKVQSKWRLFGGVFLLLVFFAFLFLAGAHLLRTEVSVAPTERGTAVRAVPGVVRITAERTIELRTEVGGRVLESALELGGRVEAGGLLLRLDDAELLQAKDRIRLDLEAEEALSEIGSLLRHDLEEMRNDLASKEERGDVPGRDLDVQRRRIARLVDEIALEEIRERRRLSTLMGEITRLEAELKKMSVRAPVEGQVIEILAFPEDIVAQRTSVARLLSRERVVEASLSEENFAGVKAGQLATVRFLAYGSRLFPATVAKVLPAANPETQRHTLHLKVEMPEELMVPGITGEVSIILGERPGALIIPRRALLGRDVFVVRDGLVKLQRVETGFVSLNKVEVTDGLQEGDKVAVENLDRLRDGDRVRVKEEE